MGFLGLGGGSLLQKNLGSNYLDQIYEKLIAQKAVLVLGPNIATMPVGDGVQMPIHEVIASELVGFLTEKKVNFDPSQAQQLDYMALRSIHSGITEINSTQLPLFVKNVFTEYATECPAVYKELAKLPFHLIINASFDTFMTQALGNRALQAHYNYSNNSAEPIGDFSPEKPLVYNIFGVYTDPESLVLSTAHQIEYMNKLIGNASRIPNAILSQLRNDTLYVFMGFSADSWHLPLLFHLLNFHQHSAAFYYDPQKISTKHEDMYRDIFKFQLKDMDPLALAKQMATDYPSWKEKKAQEKPKPTIYAPRPGQDPKTGLSKILFMTSNPKDTAHLNLNQEFNNIEEERRGKEKEFDIRMAPDINKNTLSRLLNTHQPHFLHFSGHGESSGLLFYSDDGYSDEVSGDALGRVLSYQPTISGIFLNACYSETQALALAQYVPCVIGVSNAVGDEKAMAFSKFFYRFLFNGRSYEEAFNAALADLNMQGMTSQFRFFKGGAQ